MLRLPEPFNRDLRGAAGAIALLWLASFCTPAGGQEPPSAAEPPGPPIYGDEDDLEETSPTGYIDDATVGTRFRLRYDSALNADRPDRSEFIYGKCLCFAGFGQDAASPGPAADLDFVEIELSYEHAISDRLSLFVEVPFRSVSVSLPRGFEKEFNLADVDESGIGDVRAGFKYALIADPERYLTFQLRTYLATGDAAQGLGTNHASVEPAILHHRKLSERWRVDAEARYWRPLGGSSDPITGASDPNSPVGRVERMPDGTIGPDPAVRNDDFAGDVLRLGVGLSYDVGGPRFRWTPIAELVGWYFVDGFVTPGTDLEVATAKDPETGRLLNPPGYVQEADNDTVVNLKLGVRLRGFGPGSVFLGYGFALTNEILYQGIFRAEYRVALSSPRQRKVRQAVAREAEAPRPAIRRATTGGAEASAARSERPLSEEATAEAQVPDLEREPLRPPTAVREQPQESAGPPDARATPSPQAPIARPRDEVLAAVHRWSEAWSAQRVDLYLASYSTRFRPARGMTWLAWRAQRQQRLTAPSYIRVSLDDVTVDMQGPREATVEFTQRYESNSYSDTVKKRLVMVLEGNAWKILLEESSQ